LSESSLEIPGGSPDTIDMELDFIPNNQLLAKAKQVLTDAYSGNIIGKDAYQILLDKLTQLQSKSLNADQRNMVFQIASNNKGFFQTGNIHVAGIVLNVDSATDIPQIRITVDSNLTPVVGHFKRGRLNDLIKKMDELNPKKEGLTICAITGLAGCGKSELAKVYAKEYGQDLPDGTRILRWRLDPTTKETKNQLSQASYQQSYSLLLQNFNLNESKSHDAEMPEEIHQRLNRLLWQKIDEYSRWIIIFDNAGSSKDIKRYIPPQDLVLHGQILITSQKTQFLSKNKAANFDSVNQGLYPDQAIELLQVMSDRKDEDDETSRELVKALDYSPLAIRVAGLYIYNVDGTTFQSYSKCLKEGRDQELLQMMGDSFIIDATEDQERTATLQATLQLTINWLITEKSFLLEILKYCGYLANEKILLDLLGELCRGDKDKIEDVKQKIRTLMVGENNYSLLTYDRDNECCYLHRTTQVVLRRVTPNPVEMVHKIVTVILKLYPYNHYSLEKLKLCQEAEPHFSTLHQHIIIMSQSDMSQALLVERVSLSLILGQLADEFSRYSQGVKFVEDAWHDIILTPSSFPVETQLEILRCLGHTKYYLSEYKEAEDYMKQALDICTHPDWRRAQIVNGMGQILRLDQINIEEALQRFQEAQEICKNIKPVDTKSRLQLADSCIGIGRCLRHKGQFPEALKELTNALKIFQECLGDLHQDTAAAYLSLGNLGLAADPERFVVIGDIDYEKAREYMDKSLVIHKHIFGPESYHVADSYFWLSRLLYTKRNDEGYTLALEFRDKAIKIWSRTMGSNSQQLIRSYNIKGQILHRLRRDPEAMEAYRESLRIAEYHPGKMVDWRESSHEQLQKIQNKPESSDTIALPTEDPITGFRDPVHH
jgi:tetratricopeptide (TPR) repeat protein